MPDEKKKPAPPESPDPQKKDPSEDRQPKWPGGGPKGEDEKPKTPEK